jgi:hypothetical protein
MTIAAQPDWQIPYAAGPAAAELKRTEAQMMADGRSFMVRVQIFGRKMGLFEVERWG